MQTSTIFPIPSLDLSKSNKIHLLLDHLLEDQDYLEFYQQLSSQGAGDYLILDNSAHEHGEGNSGEILLDHGTLINAHELVLPDSLFNCYGTVHLTRGALEYFAEVGLEQFLTLSPQLMIVPQGIDWFELEMCYGMLIDSIQDFSIRLHTPSITIGLSKDYEVLPGGLAHFLEKVILPRRHEFPEEPQIHILGWGRDLWALRDVFDMYGEYLRSVDSAKPVVYSLAGVRLDPSRPPPEYPKRSTNFFQTRLTIDHLIFLDWNMKVFQYCAGEITHEQLFEG